MRVRGERVQTKSEQKNKKMLTKGGKGGIIRVAIHKKNKREEFIMTLQDVINEVRAKTEGFDGSRYDGFLALQITLTDNGVFYVEVKDGKLSIEPYEYNDRQANIIMNSDDFVKMINKKLDSITAFTTGKLKIDGDISKAKELSSLFKSE